MPARTVSRPGGGSQDFAARTRPPAGLSPLASHFSSVLGQWAPRCGDSQRLADLAKPRRMPSSPPTSLALPQLEPQKPALRAATTFGSGVAGASARGRRPATVPCDMLQTPRGARSVSSASASSASVSSSVSAASAPPVLFAPTVVTLAAPAVATYAAPDVGERHLLCQHELSETSASETLELVPPPKEEALMTCRVLMAELAGSSEVPSRIPPRSGASSPGVGMILDIAAKSETHVRKDTMVGQPSRILEHWATELVTDDCTQSLPQRGATDLHLSQVAPALDDELRELGELSAAVVPHSTLEVLTVAVMNDTDCTHGRGKAAALRSDIAIQCEASAVGSSTVDVSPENNSDSHGCASYSEPLSSRTAPAPVSRARAGNTNSNSDGALSEELEEAVVSYQNLLLPRLVVGGVVRRAALQAELVGAKADRLLLSERVAKAEAENATLRAQLEGGRRGGG